MVNELYNTSNLTGSTDFVGIMQFLQVDVGIMFAELILLTVFIVAFAVFKARWDTMQSFTGAMFIAMMTSLGLYMMDLLSQTWATGSVILLSIIVILFAFFRDRG